jgi:hypothetical protein
MACVKLFDLFLSSLSKSRLHSSNRRVIVARKKLTGLTEFHFPENISCILCCKHLLMNPSSEKRVRSVVNNQQRNSFVAEQWDYHWIICNLKLSGRINIMKSGAISRVGCQQASNV